MNQSGLPMGSTVLLTIALVLLFTAPMRADNTAEATYKARCTMCHGPDGAGKTMMGEKLKIPDLHSPDVQKKPDADLKTVIAKGKNKMQGYETKLSKDQIDGLVAYIRDFAKKH